MTVSRCDNLCFNISTATGKSTVSELLTIHGFKIVDADVASRKAVEKGTTGLAQIREHFGEEAILEL